MGKSTESKFETSINTQLNDFFSDRDIVCITEGAVSNITFYDMIITQTHLASGVIEYTNPPIFITKDKELFIGKEKVPKGSEEYTSKMMELTLLGYI